VPDIGLGQEQWLFPVDAYGQALFCFAL